MTMVSLIPIEVAVGCDLFSGRPRWVRVGPDELAVRSIERIRDETAAYPVEGGPRTVFVVRTDRARLRLAYRHRERRWLMEGVDPDMGPVVRAA